MIWIDRISGDGGEGGRRKLVIRIYEWRPHWPWNIVEKTPIINKTKIMTNIPLCS